MKTMTTERYPLIETNRKVTFENIRYGMLVEVVHSDGYHAGCKVHFFNKKGALIGNIYEFMPYERLRLREPNTKKDAKVYGTTISRDYQRFFLGELLERTKSFLFIIVLNITGKLLRFTQKILD